jgi:hypothetical protein
MAIDYNINENLHEKFMESEPKGLEESWKHLIYVPTYDIRNYFGEQIAMYFHFLSYYTQSLILLIFIGIPAFIL